MDHLNSFSGVTAKTVAEAAERYGTPLYLYDETMLIEKCKALTKMFRHQTGKDIVFNGAQAKGVCVFKIVSSDFTGKKKSASH